MHLLPSILMSVFQRETVTADHLHNCVKADSFPLLVYIYVAQLETLLKVFSLY